MALGQIEVSLLAPQRNLERVEAASQEAHASGADLIVFPELADLGQVSGFDREFARRYIAAAQPVGGWFVSAVRDLARALSLHVIIGVAESHPAIGHTIFNSAVIIDGNGCVLGIQRKLHLPGEERHYFAVGDQIEIIATDLGRISPLICYDLYFPEVPRVAALGGAEIVAGVANIPYRPEWPDRLVHLAALRSYENMHYVAVVNRTGTDHGVEYGGGSVTAAPPGLVIARAPETRPATTIAVLHAETILTERARRPVFADRRPDLYRAVTSAAAPALAPDETAPPSCPAQGGSDA
jgi:predicted amidohydrolase